jgi:regulator of RNase E activity RraA
MTTRAQKLGLQGVIIDGRCRDLKEHWEKKFPVCEFAPSIMH